MVEIICKVEGRTVYDTLPLITICVGIAYVASSCNDVICVTIRTSIEAFAKKQVFHTPCQETFCTFGWLVNATGTSGIAETARSTEIIFKLPVCTFIEASVPGQKIPRIASCTI